MNSLRGILLITLLFPITSSFALMINRVDLPCDYTKKVNFHPMVSTDEAPTLITYMNGLGQGFAGATAIPGESSFTLYASCGFRGGYSDQTYYNPPSKLPGVITLKLKASDNTTLELQVIVQQNWLGSFQTTIIQTPSTPLPNLAMLPTRIDGDDTSPIELYFKTMN